MSELWANIEFGDDYPDRYRIAGFVWTGQTTLALMVVNGLVLDIPISLLRRVSAIQHRHASDLTPPDLR